jgi:ATP-binding cassette subfamily F protein 3
MKSKDVLKDALNQFNGTVIVVSHDREFLNGLSSKVYEFTNKKIKEHLGGIYDFLQSKKMDSLKELEVNKTIAAVQVVADPSDNKLNYLERKEFSKKISKMERAIANCETNIALFEEKIAEMESLLANPETMQDHSVFAKYEKAKKDLEQEMQNWENRNEELEQLIAQKGE